MTSMVGAVQAVESGELLESLGVHGRPGVAVDRDVQKGLLSSPGSRVSQSSVTVPAADSITSSGFVAEVSKVYLFAKRATDIVGSLLGLVLFSPVVAVVALIIKLTDGGPVFYPHMRVGKWGREFKCYKFRSMVVDAEHIKAEIAHLNLHDDHRTFKVPDDPRVTMIGRWVRRASIDEIPQLWNVLRGEMSLVGPRPPVPLEVERYTLDDMQRLLVKPGLTCIWQVSGRSRLAFDKQLAMDLAYIEQRSYWFDLKLILKTLPAVLSADGAY